MVNSESKELSVVKKKVPSVYKNIAIITRYESAAYNDILNILKESLSMNIYIYDSGIGGRDRYKRYNTCHISIKQGKK